MAPAPTWTPQFPSGKPVKPEDLQDAINRQQQTLASLQAQVNAIQVPTVPPQSHEVPYTVAGKPAAGQVTRLYTYSNAVSYPADFAGSMGTVGTNPTTYPAFFQLQKNGQIIGQIAISQTGNVTFTSAKHAAQSFSPGDVLTVVAPASQDATLSDLAITLNGTVSS